MTSNIKQKSFTLDEIWDILSKTQEKDIVIIEFDIDHGKIYPLCGKHTFTVYDIDFDVETHDEYKMIYLVDNNDFQFYIGKRPSDTYASLVATGENGNIYIDWIITETGQYEGSLNKNGLKHDAQLLILSVIPIPKIHVI